jgi:ATP-dependent DNA helicase RecG
MATYENSELERLLTDLESELVERKESFRTVSDKVRETVCAYANDLPDHRRDGIVLIAVMSKGSRPRR